MHGACTEYILRIYVVCREHTRFQVGTDLVMQSFKTIYYFVLFWYGGRQTGILCQPNRANKFITEKASIMYIHHILSFREDRPSIFSISSCTTSCHITHHAHTHTHETLVSSPVVFILPTSAHHAPSIATTISCVDIHRV